MQKEKAARKQDCRGLPISSHPHFRALVSWFDVTVTDRSSEHHGPWAHNDACKRARHSRVLRQFCPCPRYDGSRSTSNRKPWAISPSLKDPPRTPNPKHRNLKSEDAAGLRPSCTLGRIRQHLATSCPARKLGFTPDSKVSCDPEWTVQQQT